MLHDSDFIPYLLSTSESMVKWNLKNKLECQHKIGILFTNQLY